MDNHLKQLKFIINGLLYSRDIENIVFDNNSIINNDRNKCNGKRVIDAYNIQAKEHNHNNFKFLRNKNLDKEIFNITDTNYFTLTYFRSPTNNESGIQITTYYFKEIIISEEIQLSINPNPPKYSGVRHYFTPDILLFLKHFNKSENTINAMNYVKQYPHYFKYHTTDINAIIKKTKDIIEELIFQNTTNIDKLKKLERKIKELNNELLQQDIVYGNTIAKLEKKILNLEIDNELLKKNVSFQIENEQFRDDIEEEKQN